MHLQLACYISARRGRGLDIQLPPPLGHRTSLAFSLPCHFGLRASVVRGVDAFVVSSARGHGIQCSCCSARVWLWPEPLLPPSVVSWAAVAMDWFSAAALHLCQKHPRPPATA
jgi:hypothetical protein